MPAGRACRCSCIPFSVHCGRLPSVRRTAPVSPLRGCPGNASSFGSETGTGGAKLSRPFLASLMVLGWLTLSVECLFAGGVPGAERAARRKARCVLSSPAPRTPYRKPWGTVAESSCVGVFPMSRREHGTGHNGRVDVFLTVGAWWASMWGVRRAQSRRRSRPRGPFIRPGAYLQVQS